MLIGDIRFNACHLAMLETFEAPEFAGRRKAAIGVRDGDEEVTIVSLVLFSQAMLFVGSNTPIQGMTFYHNIDSVDN